MLTIKKEEVMFTQNALHKRSILSLSAAVLILGLAATPSMALAEGWYGGLGFGNTKAKDDTTCSDLSGILDPGYSCSTDDKDTGKKVFVGYQFNKNGAVEFGYVDLGKFTASASGTVTPPGITVSASGDTKAKGFNVTLVGSLPVTNEFAVLGRIGLFRWDVDASASASGGGVSAGGSDSATGADLTFGVGAQYDFSKTVGARVEWERFQDLGDQGTTGQSDVDLLSLSLVFRFQ
jgi:OOP family OmpA-OmpF porin